jgi:glucarate dehydratase
MKGKKMKITNTTVTMVMVPLEAPIRWGYGTRTSTVRNIVQVETDEGLVGLGESRGSQQVNALIKHFAKRVRGENPFDIERILAMFQTEPFFHGYDGHSAIAGIEMALWDLKGKATGRPVYELLGGLYRRHIPVAGYIFYRHPNEQGQGGESNPEEIVDYCKDLVDKYSFTTLKLKGGVFPPVEEVAAIAAMRAAFGPEMNLRLDPNGIWTPQTSLRVGRMLLPYDLEYLEDPTYGLDGMALLRKDVPIPLSTNMWVVEFDQIPLSVQMGAVDVILSDPHKWGGLWRTKELAAVCRTFKLGFSMHSGAELGISTAAMLHIGASTPHLMYDIDSHYHHMMDDILKGGMLQYQDGGMYVPQGPGLGVEIDEDRLFKYSALYIEKSSAESDEAQYDPLRKDWIPGLQVW